MNPGLYGCLIGALVLGVGIAAWTPKQETAPHLWPTVVGLGGLIVGLLVVGLVSGTVSRHLIQVAPAAGVLALVLGGSPYGRAAALPVVTFWGGLMAVIWLFLLDLHQLIAGHFTGVEIGLTVGIAATCFVGLRGGARPTANLSRGRRVITAAIGSVLQLAAFWASMQPFAFLS